MKRQKKLLRIVAAVLLTINMMTVSVCAEDNIAAYVQARYNNVAAATLSMGFDTSNVGYFCITLNPYSHCTGLDGMMRLLDADGNLIKSWAVYDHESPYLVENTWQCEYGKTYTVTFQGYAYGAGTMYDDIVLSVTGSCVD